MRFVLFPRLVFVSHVVLKSQIKSFFVCLVGESGLVCETKYVYTEDRLYPGSLDLSSLVSPALGDSNCMIFFFLVIESGLGLSLHITNEVFFFWFMKLVLICESCP